MRVRYQAAPHPEKENVLSGWQDSNLRPPAPKAGAITGLRYTPKRNLNRGQYVKTVFVIKATISSPVPGGVYAAISAVRHPETEFKP